MSDSITPKLEDIDSAVIQDESTGNSQAFNSGKVGRVKRTNRYNRLPKADGPIAEVLRRHAGLVSPAARALNVDRETLYNRIAKSPMLQQARATAIETVKDMAEGNVFRGIQNGDQKDTHFFLRTMGRDRGYVSSSEVSGPDGGEIKIVISPREAKL